MAHLPHVHSTRHATLLEMRGDGPAVMTGLGEVGKHGPAT
jgi:hypothetical protein